MMSRFSNGMAPTWARCRSRSAAAVGWGTGATPRRARYRGTSRRSVVQPAGGGDGWSATRLVLLATAGAQAPPALVHRLGPGDGDRPTLLDQLGVEPLRLGHQVRPRVGGADPRHGRAKREV